MAAEPTESWQYAIGDSLFH